MFFSFDLNLISCEASAQKYHSSTQFAQKLPVLDKKWQNMAGFSAFQSGPTGAKCVVDYLEPFWAHSDPPGRFHTKFPKHSAQNAFCVFGYSMRMHSSVRSRFREEEDFNFSYFVRKNNQKSHL